MTHLINVQNNGHNFMTVKINYSWNPTFVNIPVCKVLVYVNTNSDVDVGKLREFEPLNKKKKYILIKNV